MEFLTPQELLAVLKLAHEHSLRDHLMVLLGYGHGMRASEICDVRLSDISEGTITVRRLKDSKTNVQPLRTNKISLLDEVKSLAAYLAVRKEDNDFLFPSEKGGAMQGKSFWRIFKRYAEWAHLPPSKCHPHVLKSTLASHLIRNGVDLAAIQVILGHSSISSTMCYLRLNDSEANVKVKPALTACFQGMKAIS